MSKLVDELMNRMPTVQYEPQLPKDARAAFNEDGFITLKQITSDEEIAWLGEVYDALFTNESGVFILRDSNSRIDQQQDERVSHIFAPEESFPLLKKTQFWRNGRNLAAQLLNISAEELEGWGQMIRKAPRDSGEVAWHQDEGYWDPGFDYRAVTAWMPLDPATVESGCLSMIPGSHKRGISAHKMPNDDPTVTLLYCDDVDVSQSVPRPVEIGGVSFHDCKTMHWSGPNLSDRVRRAYINEWKGAPIPRAKPYDRPWYWTRLEASEGKAY